MLVIFLLVIYHGCIQFYFLPSFNADIQLISSMYNEIIRTAEVSSNNAKSQQAVQTV